MFVPGSRYQAVAEAIYEDDSGRERPYKLLRVISEQGLAVQSHSVLQNDRLDRVAFRYYEDPEQFWRICDGNRALRPDELLEEVGRRLKIPLPRR